jgi:BirA family biotin operon repressor/biotin-[acetyl-CoA-carboxylase] ligase
MQHRRHLKGPIESYPRLGSTNAEALRRAREGAPAGLILRAERQDDGRGQHQRSWHSPPGGLWFTALLRPARVEGLSLIAGLACVRATRALSVPASLRWPNDVYVGERKLAGILTESYLLGSRVDFALLGIGLNVNLRGEDFPEDLRDQATSLALEIGQVLDAEDFFERLLDELDEVLEQHHLAGLPGLLPEIRQACSTLGRWVRIQTGGGVHLARTRTLAEDGSLELEDGTRHYSVDRIRVLPY